MSTDTSRLSFAKVAAAAGKKNSISFARIAGSTSRDSRNDSSSSLQNHYIGINVSDQPNGILNIKNILEDTMPSPVSCIKDEKRAFTRSEISENEAKVLEAVKAFNITSSMPSLTVNGSSISNLKIKPNMMSEFPEEVFRRVDSGSEMGTKPPSLDDKSFTSGITFAMDEKESLRPDDSASLKASEDDDIYSGRGSIIDESGIGSEAAVRDYRMQYCKMAERRNISQIQDQTIQSVNVTHCSSSGQRLIDERKFKIASESELPEGFNLFYRQTPDEKLLEALDSTKDRIFLLRLEQEVIEFVRSSKEPFIDLPPCNSFCRMLTHKLADYYHLTHQVDAIAGAVRIFRTPFCRLPPSLTSLSNPPTSGNTPPPTTMKIMRRGGGDVGPSPSKAVSESGSDGKEKGLSAKEKLSREEREAAYNKARERIFGKEEKNRETFPESEDRNEISRSSSLSTKDRAGQNKKSKPQKQRRDDSESFDSRSQYTPFFPQPQGPTWVPSTQYSPITPQIINGDNRPFQNPLSPQYATSSQQINPVLIGPANMQPLNMTQQYSSQSSHRFQSQYTPNPSYGSPVQSPSLIPQQWSQSFYSNPYYHSTSTVRGPPNSIPYAFGQLPTTVNPADPKSQHPIPGSFNRHAFNPKTQSFVPGGIGIPLTQQVGHQMAPQLDSLHHSSTHLPHNVFNYPQQQFGNGVGYNIARQNSSSSLPSYHVSPLMAQRPLVHQTIQPNTSQGIPHGTISGIPHNRPQGMNIAHGSQVGNHLPNYGNPSTLPPKPPAGI